MGFDSGFRFEIVMFCFGLRIRVGLRGLIGVFPGSVRFLEISSKLDWEWIWVMGLCGPRRSSELRTFWIR